jgi:hypothetical protein
MLQLIFSSFSKKNAKMFPEILQDTDPPKLKNSGSDRIRIQNLGISYKCYRYNLVCRNNVLLEIFRLTATDPPPQHRFKFSFLTSKSRMGMAVCGGRGMVVTERM